LRRLSSSRRISSVRAAHLRRCEKTRDANRQGDAIALHASLAPRAWLWRIRRRAAAERPTDPVDLTMGERWSGRRKARWRAHHAALDRRLAARRAGYDRPDAAALHAAGRREGCVSQFRHPASARYVALGESGRIA